MGKSDCENKHNGDCSKVVKIINTIIDGEATTEEEQFFEEHIEKCTPCLDHYNIEKSILEKVKEKITRKSCPENTIQSIREKIKEESSN